MYALETHVCLSTYGAAPLRKETTFIYGMWPQVFDPKESENIYLLFMFKNIKSLIKYYKVLYYLIIISTFNGIDSMKVRSSSDVKFSVFV